MQACMTNYTMFIIIARQDHPIQEAFSESIHGKIHINKPRFECDINDFHFHIHLRLWVLLSTSYLQPCVQYLCLKYYTGKFAPHNPTLAPTTVGCTTLKNAMQFFGGAHTFNDPNRNRVQTDLAFLFVFGQIQGDLNLKSAK